MRGRVMRVVLFALFGVALNALFGEDVSSESLKKWNSIPVAKREALVNAYKRLRSMPKEKQEKAVERWRKFCQLPEAERKQYIEKWRRLNSMPQERKEELIRRWHKVERVVKNLVSTLPEEKQENFNKMPPQRRILETKRLIKEHSVRLFRRIAQHLSENEVEEFLSLPEDEFLSKMRELVAKREEHLLSDLLKSLPKPMQLKLAQMPKIQRREALEEMLRDNLAKQKDSLRTAGFDVGAFEGLPFHAEVLAASCAYRKVVRSAADKLFEALKSIPEEPIRMRCLTALQSGDVRALPEQFRSKPELSRFLSFPKTMREEVLGIVRQRTLHPPRPAPEQPPFTPPSRQ